MASTDTKGQIPDEAFDLKSIEVKARGGKLEFNWMETINSKKECWVEEAWRVAHVDKNMDCKQHLEQLSQHLARYVGVDFENIQLKKVIFSESKDGNAPDLQFKYCIDGQVKTGTGVILSLEQLVMSAKSSDGILPSAEQYEQLLKELELLVEAIQLNAYQFCILGEYFEGSESEVLFGGSNEVKF